MTNEIRGQIMNKIIPKTFLSILIPCVPKIFWIFSEDFRTIYTKIIFRIIAKIIFISLYSDFIDIKVVNVPGPAINGKAIGTIEAVLGLLSL